ncbi:MAG: tRNA (adenosine(37)-N6)-threonylcarbamoyltransferase complex ATPase subunit type 1 TsaE [Bacteroidota bacterium]
MTEKQYLSRSESELPMIAKNILEVCNPKRIFAFYGSLGAGKTTLIRSFCEALGVQEPVTSPTFTLVHTYEAAQDMVYHFDFYRLQSEIEAYDIGLEEYLDSGEYVFMEWPERIPGLIPSQTAKLRLIVLENNWREITLSY